MPLTHSVPRRATCTRLRARSLPEVGALWLSGLPHQLQLGRQGEGMQVVSLNDRPPRSLPDGAIRLRIGQHVHDGIGDGGRIEEIHQQPIFPMMQDFLHRRGAGAHHETSCRERLEHGPGEDEWIGKIHVHPGDLEHREEGGVRHSAQEVHATEVQGIPEFLQHLLPIRLAVGKPRAVTHFVSADDHYLSLGPLGKDGWEAPHEALEPTVGLEIARDIGNDFVLGRELAITARETEFGGRVGLYDSRVDSFVDDAQHGLISLRVKGLLPACRALSNVGCLETQEIADVLGTEPRCGIELLGNPGLELDISALRPVEEFKVPNQRGLGIDVLQVPDLAPAVVAEHDVGDEAGLLERQGSTCDFLAVQHASLGFSEVVVGLTGDLPFGAVHDLLDSGQRGVVSLSEKNDFVLAKRSEVPRDMQILSREILMNKQHFHRQFLRGI